MFSLLPLLVLSRTLKPFVEQTDEQFQEAFGKLWGYSRLCAVRAVHGRDRINNQ